ncbi:MAG: homoserine dehydrogenase [Bryobacteraceae bacterium]|nr:MAG: homoserine dehydrogenase [Bryobacteraceae bacterium]
MRVAILGYGRVARALARLIARQRHVYPFRIVAAHTLRHGTAYDLHGLPEEPAFGPPAGSAEEFLDRSRAEILVELTTLNPENGEPAASHIRAAFARGMHVATANKGPIACCYAALAEEARRAGVEFRFESSVMDGTPVFNLARHCLPGTRVLGFAGVLNSTTQVILDAMRRGLTLEEGIEEARRLGVTEADPWFDIDGWDSACKAAALANVLMDARITPAGVNRRGIGRLTPEKIAVTERAGKRIALVCRGRRTPQGVSLRVRAEVLDAGDLLAQVRGTSNVLVLHTDTMGDLGVFSLNPGLDQTAYGVFSDLVDAARSL